MKTSSEELKILINLAEEKRIRLEGELKDEVRDFFESLKPRNLINRGVGSFIQSDDLKGKAIKGGIGLGAAFLVKKFIFRSLKRSLITSLVGLAIQQGAVYFADKNIFEKIKSVANKLLSNSNGKEKSNSNGKEKEEELWDVQG